MENYARKLPRDRAEQVMTGIAVPFPALVAGNIENAIVSSVTAFNTNTTVIEIAAITAPVAIKWTNSQATSVITATGTSNFDNIIPAGVVRQFVVPRSSQAIPNYSGIQNPSVVGLNTAEGLYSAVAIKGTAIGSVLLTQY